MIRIIIEEMGRGNFSFLILVVGIVQLAVMLRKGSYSLIYIQVVVSVCCWS